MAIAGVTPLPRTRLSFHNTDGELVPAWLGERDRPWLRELIAAAEAFVGRPFAELAQHWRRRPLDPRAGRRQAAAEHVLSCWMRGPASGVASGEVRHELFVLSANGATREQALAAVAARRGIAVEAVCHSLYDDLPQRRPLCWPEPAPEPTRLALAANLAAVRGLLRFATAATLHVHGATRLLLKTAWLHGAVPAVASASPQGTTLTWRHGDLAARVRVLPSLVALLPWAHRYSLRARCELPFERGELVLNTGDPILPGPEPRWFDSGLERAFERDFRRLLPDWQLLREPAALLAGDGLAFPDFELRAPGGAPSWFCEIAGLRDRAALPHKVQLLAACAHLVLCLPQDAVPDALRTHARVVVFKRRVDAAAVARVVQQGLRAAFS